MKRKERKELIRLLEKNGWQLKREGGEHSIFVKENMRESIPRHREVDEGLARLIIKRHELKR